MIYIYSYNAIDTECEQSGSTLFITLPDGKFGIVWGNKNFSVALNKDKDSIIP